MLSKRTIEILEDNDIHLHDRNEQDGKYYREIEFYSPAGEDVIETIWYDGTDEGFISAFKENAQNFDADEHAEMWIKNRHSVSGVPFSIRALIDDAEAIKNILLEVSRGLEELETDGTIETMNRTQFYDYIIENFNISGEATRLISNILYFVEENYTNENEQYRVLCSLLDNTIGLSDREIKRVYL